MDQARPAASSLSLAGLAFILLAAVAGDPATDHPCPVRPSGAAEILVFDSASPHRRGRPFAAPGRALTPSIAPPLALFGSNPPRFLAVRRALPAGGAPTACGGLCHDPQAAPSPTAGSTSTDDHGRAHYFDILPMYMAVLAMVPAARRWRASGRGAVGRHRRSTSPPPGWDAADAVSAASLPRRLSTPLFAGFAADLTCGGLAPG